MSCSGGTCSGFERCALHAEMMAHSDFVDPESGGTTPTEDALLESKMPDPEKNPFDALTERERLVAKTLALGIPSRTIASELHIASKTVGSHRAAVLRKVGASNNVELARLAIRWGVVPPP